MFLNHIKILKFIIFYQLPDAPPPPDVPPPPPEKPPNPPPPNPPEKPLPPEEAEEGFQKYREYLVSEKAYQGELKDDIKGFVGNDPYYGNCVISVIKGRIVGILGNPGDAVSILKSIERGM